MLGVLTAEFTVTEVVMSFVDMAVYIASLDQTFGGSCHQSVLYSCLMNNWL